MTPLVRSITRLTSVGLLTVGLAACGSSGSDSADTTAAESTTTQAKTATSGESSTSTSGTDSTTSTTGQTTSTSGMEPETTVVTPTSIVSKKDSVFCNTIANYSSGLSGSTAGTSPATLRTLVDESQEKAETLRASAPGEIKGDINTVFDASDKLVAALEKVDYDVSRVDQSVANVLSTPQVEAAGKRVETFVLKDCGFDLDAASSDTPSASRPTTTP